MFKNIRTFFINWFPFIFLVSLVFAVIWWFDSWVDSRVGEERKAKEVEAYQEKLVSLVPFVQKVIEMQPRGLDKNLDIHDIFDITLAFDSTLEFQDYFLDNNIHISEFYIEDVQRIDDRYEYFTPGYDSIFALKCKIKPKENFKYESFIVIFKVEKVENNYKNNNSYDADTFVSGNCYEMEMATAKLFNDAKDLILDVEESKR